MAPTFLQNFWNAGIRQWISVPKILVVRLTGHLASDKSEICVGHAPPSMLSCASPSSHTKDEILLHLTQQVPDWAYYISLDAKYFCGSMSIIILVLTVPPLQKLFPLWFLIGNSKRKWDIWTENPSTTSTDQYFPNWVPRKLWVPQNIVRGSKRKCVTTGLLQKKYTLSMLYWNEFINDFAKILTWFCSTCF